jgi:hypothetical protein
VLVRIKFHCRAEVFIATLRSLESLSSHPLCGLIIGDLSENSSKWRNTFHSVEARGMAYALHYFSRWTFTRSHTQFEMSQTDRPLKGTANKSYSSSSKQTLSPHYPTMSCNDEKESMNGQGHGIGECVNTRKSVIGLIPYVQDYAWGIRGMDSRVARYALESKSLDEVDPDTPYAELWIGTHPSGPARLKTGEMLRDVIGEDLPFLFKVLSAGKALSIQAHPDKENAERLHLENPTQYGDPNHKPEMAIALTPFEAMCGFRRLEEISYLIKKHPEFAACISQEAKLAVFLASEALAQKEALQMLFSSFMTCDPDVSAEQLKLLLIRLQAEQSNLHPHPHDEPAW